MPESDDDAQNASPTSEYQVGYGKPPKHSQFASGTSGNPRGRPKQAVGISIQELLDSDQLAKNGEVVSKRKALVVALVNGALQGDQKAFARFMRLMDRSGLMRREQSSHRSVIEVPMVQGTMEEFKASFGRKLDANERNHR